MVRLEQCECGSETKGRMVKKLQSVKRQGGKDQSKGAGGAKMDRKVSEESQGGT